MLNKSDIIQQCRAMVEERINVAQNAVNNAQYSANEESRSTAGDKYDTARSMSQLNKDMYAKQLQEALNLKKALNLINPKKNFDSVELGALVYLQNEVCYFVSVSLGAVHVKDHEVFMISPMTPLAQAMLGKRGGDTYIFNKKSYQIKSVH